MRPLTGHPWLDASATITGVSAYTTTTDGSQVAQTSAATIVACCVQPHTGREMLQHSRDTGKRVSLGLFDPLTSTGAATSIERDARLSITDAAGLVRKFRAMGPHRDESGVGVVLTCDLEEVS